MLCIFYVVALHWITIGLTMIGKLSITVSYFHIFLMVSETFPTVLKSFALGTCSSSGRVGAMISAYVGDLVGNIYFTYLLCLLFR